MELVLVFIKWNIVLQRSKDEEIELVPEDEFFRDAPKEISKPVSNVDFVVQYHRTFLPAVNCILSDGSCWRLLLTESIFTFRLSKWLHLGRWKDSQH